MDGGPLKEKDSVRSISAANDTVEVLDISRVSPVVSTQVVLVFSQDLKSMMCRSTREGEYRHFRVEYYVSINLGVSRGIASVCGVWPGKVLTTFLLGDSHMERDVGVDEAETELGMVSHCLAVVPSGTFREDSIEEISLDISPLNSNRGESVQSDQSEWVRQNMEVFSKQMGVSIEGCESEAMALFTAIERRWRQPGISRTMASTNKHKARKGIRELRNLTSSINYGVSLNQGSGRRFRGSAYSQCI